ncbi:MAG: PLP-dependent aminotransferase family protein [Chloroflexota bacterium]|jgi:2-aminoadipate transaminase|nr:PLP-dependent aminotransferase family protein [Chloroflexota bacterium]MDP6758166.1 PLP-dependent aminotransferase family protein [Chloroflexota bacterium]
MPHTSALDIETLLSADARARRKTDTDEGGASTPDIRISLSSGQPDPHSMPVEDLATAMQTVLENDRSALLYGARDGYAPLRQVVADKTNSMETLRITADDVIITTGAAQAIGLAAQAFLDRGAPMLIDEASWGTLVFRAFGPHSIPVRWDEDGPIIADIERAVDRLPDGERMRLFYTIPNFQNPMGTTTTLERRRQVLDLARRHRFLILEDDAYFELRFAGESLPSYYELDKARSHVIRTGTFSKILGAGVRLGWAIAPAEIREAMMLYKFDLGSNPFMSRVVATYMQEHLEGHVEELREVYHGRRDAMLAALEEGLGGIATWSRPEGGFFIWVKLPDGVDSGELERATMARGVDIWPGKAFRMDEHEDGYVRLAYSLEKSEQIAAGVAIFSEVVRELCYQRE